jgi:mono/diheme cytochrome c family protein
MAAFHQQCIGCHQSMGLEKPAATACADCHKERKK